MKHLLTAALLSLLGCRLAWAAASPEGVPPGFDPQKHMRVAEVKDGMTGYGLSVFRGTKIERFEVEVISVLKNFNPKHDVVLVRFKGANLEHTGGIQGMSGSPVYLTDEQGRSRMIGAFAYGWQLMKDPIGGVQPIEYMLGMPVPENMPPSADPNAAVPSAPPPFRAASTPRLRWSLLEAIPAPWSQEARTQGVLALLKNLKPTDYAGDANDSMRLRPLTTPLMTSGLPQTVLDMLEPALKAHGMAALQAGGISAEAGRAEAPAKLEPGSAIAVPIMIGDADMTAIGTVTEVVGNRVLAFGHAFFSEGDVSLPMGSGYIHSVIASIVSSFKLGSATQIKGTLHNDQLVGIAGKLGPAPTMIPIEVRCVYADGSFDQTYRYQAAQHPRFTPLMASTAASVAVSSRRELPQYHTLDYDLSLEFANGQTLRVQNRSVNSSVMELFLAIAQPIMMAAENPFERVGLKKMSGTIRVLREARQAEILSVSIPRLKYRPGDMLKAFVTYRPFRGAEAILPLEFELPRDLPDGKYDFAVTDSMQHLQDEQAARPFRFTAESAQDVFAVLRDFTGVRKDAIYLRLMRQPDGVAIGRTAMPRLPSSRRRVLMGAGLSNTTTFVSSTVKSVATDYVMSGQARFQITIDKDATAQTANRPGPGPEAPAGAEEAKPKPAEKAQTPKADHEG